MAPAGVDMQLRPYGPRRVTKLKLTAIDNSVGVVFPKEVLARLKLDKGDSVYLTEPWAARIRAQSTAQLLCLR